MSPARISAGLLMYRLRAAGVEVFLVHPGGPFFEGKDAGAWTVPKGMPEADECDALLECARREFAEETGLTPPGQDETRYLPLDSVRQKGGKLVHAWAFEGDWPPGRALVSNTFAVQWPPGSGRWRSYPEIDRGEFFELDLAAEKINPAQRAFLERLREHLAAV